MENIKSMSTRLELPDYFGSVKARLGIGRMDYKIKAGLYKIGNPDENAEVFVTSNYKLTTDMVRKSLEGVDCWLLVLDTKGVNVWCAAGKGTFGTDELINRINKTRLGEIVEHRRLILPQLGAVGVAAHKVKKATGFDVNYGPVRAEDIKEYITNGFEATDEMRHVRFNLLDRAVLVPVEVAIACKPTIIALGILMITNALGLTKISKRDVGAYIGAVLIGTALVPIALPKIPARAFSLKGWLLGVVWALLVSKKTDYAKLAQYLLVLPPVAGIFGMNFTGSSTYTSMTGVKKEMTYAMPIFAASIFAGIVLIVKSAFRKKG